VTSLRANRERTLLATRPIRVGFQDSKPFVRRECSSCPTVLEAEKVKNMALFQNNLARLPMPEMRRFFSKISETGRCGRVQPLSSLPSGRTMPSVFQQGAIFPIGRTGHAPWFVRRYACSRGWPRRLTSAI
jgi:hypothetical protein